MSDEEIDVEEIDPPETPRLIAWYGRSNAGGTDRPHISIWWPQEPPTARLQTIGHGCDRPDTLPNGPLMAHVRIGGIDFGGQLDDLEWLLDAAREAITVVRWQAEQMQAEAARSGSVEG